MHAKAGRIGLFGFFGSGNFGNDGSLEAMLNFLRRVRPASELVCICVDPQVVEDAYAVRTIAVGSSKPSSGLARWVDRVLLSLPHRIFNWARSFWHVRGIDVLIIPGTGIADDFATGPFGAPYALFRWCLAAWLCGARIAFVSVGAGPIHHPVSRWFMKSALRLAEYRSFRDARSRDFLESIGLPATGDPVFPDIAFSLPEPEPRLPTAPESRRLTVGLGVMAYYGWRNDMEAGSEIYRTYLQKLTDFARWLLAQGHDVRLLMGETTDERAVKDLKQAIKDKEPEQTAQRVSDEVSHSLHDLMRQMVNTDIVVATRFHNIVCALKLERPAVSVGYAKKNQLLLEEVGLGEFSQPIESLDVHLLIEQFQILAERRNLHAPALAEGNRLRQEQLRTQEAMLVTILPDAVIPARSEALALR